MPKIDVPTLQYSSWHKWEDRASITGADQPGIYLLAIKGSRPVDANATYKDVCYIGMTVSKAGLKGRWRQLDRSLRGSGGHSGANSIFAQRGAISDWGRKQLYVAAMPVPCNTTELTAADLRTQGKICYLEYEAFAQFFEHQHKKPDFNTR